MTRKIAFSQLVEVAISRRNLSLFIHRSVLHACLPTQLTEKYLASPMSPKKEQFFSNKLRRLSFREMSGKGE